MIFKDKYNSVFVSDIIHSKQIPIRKFLNEHFNITRILKNINIFLSNFKLF